MANAPTLLVPLHRGLDLLRVLRGRPLLSEAHSRRNISASLRGKRTQLGRAPTAADFPDGHAKPIMALAYWGGIDLWTDAAPLRAQRPKGHWAGPANQEAALRDTTARFPNASITYATLHHGHD